MSFAQKARVKGVILDELKNPVERVTVSALDKITFTNENGFYTINHINKSIVNQAHYTSAKFERGQSEFDFCGLTEEFLGTCKAPFVKESQVKIGMQFLECLPIKANGTVLVIGEVTDIFIPDDAIDINGHIDIGQIDTIGISGLSNYYQLEKLSSLPYARVSELPDFAEQ